MAPVDPTELIKAFKPCLTELGGIKSISNVPKLFNLMKRYSKKLVSRCIFCSILLSTEPDILQCFLEEQDGWELINAWLKEGLKGENYPYICELIDLLDKCPMTVERLKKNDTPKLVKQLAKTADKEISDKAKTVVTKWYGLIKANENINNGNLARKKRKKDKSIDDEDSSDSTKLRKVKGGGVLQQQASVNDATVTNSSSGDTANKPTSTTKSIEDDDSVTSSSKSEQRPRTAKVSFGKSRGLGLLEDSSTGSSKLKGSSKKGEEPHSTTDKSGPGKNIKLNSKSADSSASVSSSGQAVQAKTVATAKPKHTLKEAVGFITDIVNLSTVGPVRKRRKSESRSKSTTTGSNAAKDSGSVESSNNGDEQGQEPMDTDDLSDEMDDERVASASGDDSNSNAGNNNNNNINNLNSNNNDDDRLPIVDVPEIDNLVIPEIDASKLPGVFKSILSYGRPSNKSKKSVRWRAEDRLKEIRFFELDETERANVSKGNFGDYRSIDIKNERQMLQQIRNKGIPVVPGSSGTPIAAPTAEKSVSYLPWRLILIELPPGLPLTEAGSQSEEKRIQAEATRNSLNSDFFPTIGTAPEYYPKEPDLLEPSENITGPRKIPLEDENFTVNDFSQVPPPQPKTGESYSANRGPVPGPTVPVPGSFHTPVPGMGGPPRPPGGPIPRTPYPPAGFVPPVAGYPPYAGPYTPPVAAIPPGSGRLIPPRPIPPAGFQPPPGAWQSRPRVPPICRNFLKNGNCRFMARCNYLHQYPNSNNSHGPNPSSSQPHME